MKNKYLNQKKITSSWYKTTTLILGIMFSTLMGFSQTIDENYIDGEIYVKIKDDYRKDSDFKSDSPDIDLKNLPFLDAARKKHNLKIKSSFYFAKSEKLRRTLRISTDNFENIDQLIREITLTKEVEYVEKVPLNRTSLTPNDLGSNTYSGQWGLHKIQAQTAWNLTTGSSNIVVAVVDDAVMTNHSDLSGKFVTGRDVSDNDNNTNPPSGFGHGTHVAGIVGAATNNGNGIASIGYNVKIMPIKATPNNGTPGFVYDGYEGITWAADNGADVINMSWGGFSYLSTAQNVVNYAASQGVVLVAAAGNDNVSNIHYPAGYNNVISVAATDINDNKASFSNYGSWIDVSAPGVSIRSTIISGGYANWNGTSMASPMVAGLCGLVLSANPALSPAQVENCIKTSADPISSFSGNLGTGRINAYKAVQCAGGGGSCNSTVTSFPYNESFESGLGAWTQGTGDNINWTRRSGSTPSGGTGPSSASQGTYYMYTESSGNGSGFPNKVANLVSPCFNLSSVSNPLLVFKYHMYGSAMGTLRVQVSTNNGSTWTTLWTRTGNQGNSWQTANVNLNSYTSQSNLKIRFNGTTGSSYTSDMAIDDIKISGGTSGGCTLSTSPSSSISLSNSATSSSIYVYSTASWTASDNASWITLNTTSGNGNGNLPFSVTANTSTSSRTGTITINCGSSSTTVVVTQAGATPSSCINLFPYDESFESGLGAWTQDTGDNINWTRRAGSTPSSNTGPSSASQGTYYMYTESSGNGNGFPNKVANLVSPCFNLSSVSSPTFTFKYHMYGSTMGTLRVQVSTNNGSSWTTLWTKTGNQGNSWQTASVSLNSYTSQTALKIRFNGTTGSSYTSDMAIDDVNISGGGSSCTSLSVSPTSANPSCNAGGQGINISSNGTWTVSDNASWITISQGNNAPAAIFANYTQNTGTSSRTGVVTITCGNITRTVTITQQACSGCTPTTPTASQIDNSSNVYCTYAYGICQGHTGDNKQFQLTNLSTGATTNYYSTTHYAYFPNLTSSTNYRYRVRKQCGTSGAYGGWSPYENFTTTSCLIGDTDVTPPTGTVDTEDNTVFKVADISGIRNYPNPFNAQTTIEFTLEEDVPVNLFVSDLTGKQIAVLLDGEQKLKGTHQAIFDGNNYPAGMYYYTIQAGDYVATQKMTLVK